MVTTKTRDRSFGAVAIIVMLVLTLVGCGGGGSGLASTGGISGTGLSVGTVTGFGSVFVNGTEFDTTGAAIVIDGSDATQGDLRVGQVVVVSANFDDHKASRVEYRAQIKGPIQALTVQDAAVGVATLTVMGQTVATNSSTNLSGARLDPTLPNALKVGDRVEISGLLDANGVLVATFLEVEPALADYRVIGRVSNLTTTTFNMGALTVDFGSASAAPRVGDMVEVTAAAAGFNAGSNTLIADRIETIAGVSLSGSESAEVEGYVTRFAGPSDFDVGSVHAAVDSSTQFEGGSVSSLAQNVKVEIKGNVNSSGVLVAQSVEIESTGSIRIEGSVEQIDAARQQLTVLGVTFAVRAGADFEDESSANAEPFTFADIAVGDRLQIRAFLDDGVVVASEIERDDPRSDARLRGQITAINPVESQLAILGVTVTGDAATVYHEASGQAAFFNAVRVGDVVDAQWNDFTATTAPADELSMEDD